MCLVLFCSHYCKQYLIIFALNDLGLYCSLQVLEICIDGTVLDGHNRICEMHLLEIERNAAGGHIYFSPPLLY